MTVRQLGKPTIIRFFYSRFFFLVLFTGCFSSLQIAAANALSGPEQHVVKIANSVMNLANSSKSRSELKLGFEQLLGTYANMNGVARFALGRYRKSLSASKKRSYYNLVKKFVAGLFVEYVDDFRGNQLVIRRSRPNGKAVIVDSQIKFSHKLPAPVEWRVSSNNSRHRVTDVKIRGVWMRLQMRQKFVRILKKNQGDINALMTYLQAQ